MSSAAFSKSKAFKEKEQKVKESLRRATKQDLVADLSRLFSDSTFTDVILIVDKREFPVHAAILKARAPNFSQHFLPAHVSSDAIQTCIQINGIDPTEFEAFLWSAYTEDYFKDYDQASYPWTKQELSCSTLEHSVLVTDSEVSRKAQPWLQLTSSEIERDNSNKLHSDAGVCAKNTTDKPAIDYQKQMEDFDGDISMLGSCKKTCSQTLEANCITNGLANSVISMQRRGINTHYTDSKEALEAEDNENTLSTVEASVCHTALQNDSSDGFEESIRDESETAITQNKCVQPAATEEISLNQNCGPCNGLDSTVQLNELIVKTSDLTMTNLKIRKTLEGILITNDDELFISIEMGRPGIDDLHKADMFTHANCRVNGCVSCNSILGCETMPELAKDHVASADTGNSTCSKTIACMMSEDELLESCCKLGQDLLKLLRSGIESDVTFLVGEKLVKAHKAILCARSNYFSAMLHGGWSEEMHSEIPLIGVNYNGMMIVLNYIYGGTAQVPSDVGTICDVLVLADMYGLERLKEVIISTLRIEKCHLFHKPCGECMTSIFECLELSEMFQLTDLKLSCIKWVAKHFDRLLSTKGFAFLPKALQDEIVAEIQSCILVSTAIEVLNHCDRLCTCTPPVKWTEPVHAAVSAIQDACLLLITNRFFSLVGEKSFEEVLKGVGWSMPVLEKIFSAVQGNLTVESCCTQLRAVLKLRGLLKQKATEEEESEKKNDESYPREVIEHVEKLHSRCVEYIRSNLFKVTRSSGWKQLNPKTQREVKEGAVFMGLGETGTRASLAQTSRRPPVPTRSSVQAAGTRSRTAGRGRQGTGSVGPTAATGKQGSSTLTASCMRPPRGRPSSAQTPLPKGRGKTPSSSQGSSSKRPSSAKPSPSSNLHTSGRKPSSGQMCSSSNRASAVKELQGAVPSVNEPSLASGKKSCSSAVALAGETFLKGHGRGTSSAERSSSKGCRGGTGKGFSTPRPSSTFKNSIQGDVKASTVVKSSKVTKSKKAHEAVNKGTQKESAITGDMANQKNDHGVEKPSKESNSKTTHKALNEEIQNEREATAALKPNDKANQESHSTQQIQECHVNPQQNYHEQLTSHLNGLDSSNGEIQNELESNKENSARNTVPEESLSTQHYDHGTSKLSDSKETLEALDEGPENE